MAGVEFASVHQLKEMTDYQEDAIVSRTVMGKKSGTITLFAFDESQALSEHTAPFDAMVIILDGAAEVSIDAETFQLKENDMIIFPANIPHAVQAIQRFKMMLVMLKEPSAKREG